MATIEDFDRIDVRIGKVLSAEPFPEGKYSTHILVIDFGPEIGQKKSLARLAPNYQGPELVGRLVAGVVNFPPRQIGKHTSEVLTLGFNDTQGNTVLIQPERDAPLGARLC
jgi:tRNA-binding protein